MATVVAFSDFCEQDTALLTFAATNPRSVWDRQTMQQQVLDQRRLGPL